MLEARSKRHAAGVSTEAAGQSWPYRWDIGLATRWRSGDETLARALGMLGRIGRTACTHSIADNLTPIRISVSTEQAGSNSLDGAMPK